MQAGVRVRGGGGDRGRGGVRGAGGGQRRRIGVEAEGRGRGGVVEVEVGGKGRGGEIGGRGGDCVMDGLGRIGKARRLEGFVHNLLIEGLVSI